MSDDKFKFQLAGIKWLYEMELLDDPQLINNLKLNILGVSSSIKEVEFVMDQNDRKILIWVDLTWWGQMFRTKLIAENIVDILSQLLPNYQFRVITDKSILDKAVKYAMSKNGIFKGGTYAVSNPNTPDDINQRERVSEDVDSRTSKERSVSETSNLLSDQEQQASNGRSESDEAIESDLQSDEETQDPS